MPSLRSRGPRIQKTDSEKRRAHQSLHHTRHGTLGEAANAAARTDAFLGARYRRIVKRRGHAKALIAVARSILVITWHLINEPHASHGELGADWHQRHLNPARRTRDLVRQLQSLGHQVTLEHVPA